jgi:hypothetical protein
VQATLNAAFGAGAVKASVEAGFSYDSSVELATKMKTDSESMLAMTSAQCLTSRVLLRTQPAFDPQFLEDLQEAVAGPSGWDQFFSLYGFMIYSEATLGGRLAQISTFSRSSFEITSEIDTERSLQMNFGASVTAGNVAYGGLSISRSCPFGN